MPFRPNSNNYTWPSHAYLINSTCPSNPCANDVSWPCDPYQNGSTCRSTPTGLIPPGLKILTECILYIQMYCILAFFQQAFYEEFTTVFTDFSPCYIFAGQLLTWFKCEQERTVSSRPHYRYSNGTNNRRYLCLLVGTSQWSATYTTWSELQVWLLRTTRQSQIT